MSIFKIGRTARIAGLAVLGAALTLGVATGIAEAASASQAHHGAGSTVGMYGNPAAAAPFWRQQSLDDCALMATADVIGQLTQREVSEQEILAVAQRLPSRSHPGPIYSTGYGTDPADIPVLLAQYGIYGVVTSQNYAGTTGLDSGMEALEHYLADGHKVIAGVNAELIWGLPVETKDNGGNPMSDHAVVVTGVDVANGKVHLNDSGNPNGKDEVVSLEVFIKSWATSSDAMIVTRETS